MEVQTQNKKGDWIPTIPEPYYGMVYEGCECGQRFYGWDMHERYLGHYALKHILAL